MRNALKNPKTTVTDLFLHNRDYISIWKINFIKPMKEILTFFKLLHLKKDYTFSQLQNLVLSEDLSLRNPPPTPWEYFRALAAWFRAPIPSRVRGPLFRTWSTRWRRLSSDLWSQKNGGGRSVQLPFFFVNTHTQVCCVTGSFCFFPLGWPGGWVNFSWL